MCASLWACLCSFACVSVCKRVYMKISMCEWAINRHVFIQISTRFIYFQALRIPVIVASESYKFCEKVQLDSIVYNELGSTAEIVCGSSSSGEGSEGMCLFCVYYGFISCLYYVHNVYFYTIFLLLMACK